MIPIFRTKWGFAEVERVSFMQLRCRSHRWAGYSSNPSGGPSSELHLGANWNTRPGGVAGKRSCRTNGKKWFWISWLGVVASVQKYMCIYMFIWAYVCTYMYVYAYIYIYILPQRLVYVFLFLFLMVMMMVILFVLENMEPDRIRQSIARVCDCTTCADSHPPSYGYVPAWSMAAREICADGWVTTSNVISNLKGFNLEMVCWWFDYIQSKKKKHWTRYNAKIKNDKNTNYYGFHCKFTNKKVLMDTNKVCKMLSKSYQNVIISKC